MEFTYELHTLAEQDIIEAHDWYDNITKGLGDRFIAAVEKKIEKILLRPYSYSSKGNSFYREALVAKFPF